MSTVRRVRAVMAIPAFRRLWVSSYLCCVGDWLSLLALSALVATLTADFEAHTFAFSGVVVTQLLPGLLLAPLAGVAADKFDRRKVMIVSDLSRCVLFLSIAVVGSTWWLFVANFLVGCCSMVWIPAKDAIMPGLLRDPEQVETANQLTLLTTYGLALLSGTGLYTLTSAMFSDLSSIDIAYVIVIMNGLLYLASAVIIMHTTLTVKAVFLVSREKSTPLSSMLLNGIKFIISVRWILGLTIGISGAMAAAGTLIASARPYIEMMHGGETGFGLLFVSLVVGSFIGLLVTPTLTKRVSRERSFAVVVAVGGVALFLFANVPVLWCAFVLAIGLGLCAGVAFVVALTAIGTQVVSAMRGRVNAATQTLVKLVLFGTTVFVPQVIGWSGSYTATRPVLSVAAIVCIAAGLLAAWHMTPRELEAASGMMEAEQPVNRRSTVEAL